MKEEDELLRKYGTHNPFVVPEGYFEDFSKKLMESLPEKETTQPAKEISMWQRLKPWVYMAAMFCGLMFSIRVMVKPSQQSKAPVFTATEVEHLTDEYIESLLGHSMMDDYALYQYLTDADSDF